jgi:hypothetical protein
MSTYAGQYGSDSVFQQNTVTKLLVGATSVEVRLRGTTTKATLYTDPTKGTSLSNPLPVGVTVGQPGVDAAGGTLFFTDKGRYDLFVNGTYTLPIVVLDDPLEPLDVQIASSDLTDTDDSGGVSVGDVRSWNGTKWVPGPPATGGSGTGFRADMTVAAGTVAIGNFLIPGGLWIPDDTVVSTLFAHLTTPPTGQDLIFDLVTSTAPTSAPSYVGAGTPVSFSANTATIGFPSGANAAGTLLLVVGERNALSGGTQVTGAPGTGWTSIYDEPGGTNVSPNATWGSQFAWWKNWASGDGTSLALPTLSASTSGLVQSFAWTGASTVSPIDTATALSAGFIAAGGQLSFPTLTTSQAQEILVGVVSQQGNTPGTTTWANLTKRTDQNTSTNTLSVATGVQAAAGTSAVVTATMAAASNYQGRVFSIAPQAATVLATITVPAGQTTAVVTGQTINLTANTLVNINVRQIGSTAAGTGLALGLKGT